MAKFAAVLFSIVAAVYLGFLVFGMIQVWPWGIVGLVVLAGFIILFGCVIKQRVGNAEDDHYSKNVEK